MFNTSQINNAVIEAVTVDVIDVASRPRSMMDCPCQSMRSIADAKNPDSVVSTVFASGDRSDYGSIAHANSPFEDAGIVIVGQDFTKKRGGDGTLIHSHIINLMEG